MMRMVKEIKYKLAEKERDELARKLSVLELENKRLFDECARLSTENADLKEMLDWYRKQLERTMG